MFDNKWQKKEMPLVSLIGMGGGIASPAFLASIVLNILKPTVFSPADDTGVPDFDYTAESSAITDISTSDVLGGEAFSTTLYTGNGNGAWNGGNNTVPSGLDFTEGDWLSWIKVRDAVDSHFMSDSTQKTGTMYDSFASDRQYGKQTGESTGISAVGADGYTIDGQNNQVNATGKDYVAWNFRVAPGFFDIVTFSGDGVNGRAVPHNLGTAPAFIMLKNLTLNENWMCYHKDAGMDGYLAAHERFLQINYDTIPFPTSTSSTPSPAWGNTAPDETHFYLGGSVNSNSSGSEFVAYLFADNPSNQIQCGTYTGNGTSGASSNATHLDFDPEWLLVKNIDSNGSDWCIVDTSRGQLNQLTANGAGAESNTGSNGLALFTGHFQAYGSSVDHNQSGDRYVYVAIGSPKVTVSNTQLTLTDTTVSRVSDGSLIEGESIDQVLTVGETVQADTATFSTVSVSVFNTTIYQSGSGNEKTITTGIDNTDKSLVWIKSTTLGYHHKLMDSERGSSYPALSSDNANPETGDAGIKELTSDGFVLHGGGYDKTNDNNNNEYVAWNFRAAPGFFDIQTYTGISEGSASQSQAISHDLGSEPGMIIVKNLDAGDSWFVYHKDLADNTWIRLNEDWAKSGPLDGVFPSTQTSTEFNIGADMSINRLNDNYVAYLFADTPGKIKCGTYTGNGGPNSVDAGITGGCAWAMVKNTSNSGDWSISDSQRYYGNDHLYANNNNQEDSSPYFHVNDNGFGLNTSDANWNAPGDKYIYVAIAENAMGDITTQSIATGKVSASSGNTVTLSNSTGTWSTGMKVQGVTTDTKDYPDPIRIEDVSLTSSAPTAEKNVNTWGDAVWEIATDENFTQNVQTATTALSATGTQAGPSFTLERDTGYYTRTKYTALGQESEWSDVTYFVTKGLPVYADDVFSTYLYEGNADTSGSQTINNGIDLAGEGGFVWIKRRTAGSHILYDTERGATQALYTTPDVESARPGGLTSFNNNGFTVGNYTDENAEGQNVVAWTFRKAPGFLDIVTYTGNSTAGHTISHSLGSVPGMIIIKNTSNYEQWQVWHRSVTGNLELDNTGAANTSSVRVDSVTSTSFNLTSGWNTSNADGQTYVAYIFAHDDARFGANGDESIIKCGSITTSSGEIPDVNLGFEPQFLLIKNTSTSANWYLYDSMRGMPVGSPLLWGNEETLYANLSNAAVTGANTVELTSTGFTGGPDNLASGTETLIYMAIRRPHKPATVVSDVFAIDTKSTFSANNPQYTSNFPVDFAIRRNNITSQDSPEFVTRLTNAMQYTNKTDAEYSGGTSFLGHFAYNNGWANTASVSDPNDYLWMFKRSPGFMDVVTYSGTSSVRTVDHNLGVAPELLIVKSRSTPSHWAVYNATSGASKALILSGTISEWTIDYWNNTAPTATQFTVGTDGTVNSNGNDYVAYLFATQPGISKVGSYVGNGPNGAQQVDCGFTNGAAFILVKNASSSSDWYLLDSERGINAYNETEPYIRLNTREYGQANMLGHHNVGFMVAGQYGSPLNNAGETYIFLAIANP